MPVPNPTTLELAQAGAIIVGVHQRDRQLLLALRNGQRWDFRYANLAMFVVAMLVVFGFVFASAFDSAGIGLPLAAAAGLLGLISLAAAASRSAAIALADLGYTPEQLAALVGYVEIDDDGNLRETLLGKQATAAYLAWRDPEVAR